MSGRGAVPLPLLGFIKETTMARVKFRQNCKGKMPDGKKIYPSECEMSDAEARKFIAYGMADEVSPLAFVETEVVTEVVDKPDSPPMGSRGRSRADKR